MLIEVALCALLLALHGEQESIRGWLREIIDRSVFAYRLHMFYPCTISVYDKLLEHPRQDDAYRLEGDRREYPVSIYFDSCNHDGGPGSLWHGQGLQ